MDGDGCALVPRQLVRADATVQIDFEVPGPGALGGRRRGQRDQDRERDDEGQDCGAEGGIGTFRFGDGGNGTSMSP